MWNLVVSQPDYGAQAFEITGALVGSGGIDVAVVDSVAALVPKAELDGRYGRKLHGTARPPDVASVAQTDRQCGAHQHAAQLTRLGRRSA